MKFNELHQVGHLSMPNLPFDAENCDMEKAWHNGNLSLTVPINNCMDIRELLFPDVPA